MLSVHPLYGLIPNPYLTKGDFSQDMKFEALLDNLKKIELAFKEPRDWSINFFINEFLTSKENAREILKAFQEGIYNYEKSNDYKIQEEPRVQPRRIPRHISDFANKIICLEKAYSNSSFMIRSSIRNGLSLEKANFLREAFEELVKEENNNYIKTVNNIYQMLPVWKG